MGTTSKVGMSALVFALVFALAELHNMSQGREIIYYICP